MVKVLSEGGDAVPQALHTICQCSLAQHVLLGSAGVKGDADDSERDDDGGEDTFRGASAVAMAGIFGMAESMRQKDCVGDTFTWSLPQKAFRKAAKGEYLESPTFSIGTLAGCKLWVYPRGDDEADVGYCSMYFEVPHPCHIKCRFFMLDGQSEQSRVLLHKFESENNRGYVNC